ncbi:21 kDa protein [Tripterygium wilfordii]|uniref:21 kDa protein n=1 Tax=Tripterygium wilfordii TaxID=458696 RepID=A0A7J7DCN0_TRIWF|nr:pectinesterase inhibitor 6-like [Tripterygium wilfordii]KAF5744135.1 21 kDa protein [Tripterygium wilfordii]
MPILINLIASIFFVLTINTCHSAYDHHTNSYVQEACSVTKYQDLCVHSLASFSTTAKRSPSRWARAGVSVAIGEAKSVDLYLIKLKRIKRFQGRRNIVALSDCSECFQDAIDRLHGSLGVLRRLNARNFDNEIEDLTTWLSAALTDADTCLDGFEGQNAERVQVKVLRNRVIRASYITSNALALVNKLAGTGIQGLTDP